MTEEQQLKLQAFLDKELPEADSREVEAWLANDADAVALRDELKNMSRALAGSELESKVPESREFYWSKIKREIERTGPKPERVETVSFFTTLRRALMPLGAVAVLTLVGFITLRGFSGGQRPIAVNSMLADAGAFTYRDETQGMTVVWLSYPAENKFAEKASGDTLSPQ